MQFRGSTAMGICDYLRRIQARRRSLAVQLIVQLRMGQRNQSRTTRGGARSMLGLQVDLKQGRMFDGGSDNPYEGVALSQAAAASIALFQRCSFLEIRGREAA